MSAQPKGEEATARRALPDYLPARMINEHVYCPRLFYFEQVEGVFAENEYTVEGSAQHKRVDKEGRSAPAPDDESEEPVVVRSITLSSEKHRVIAKLDLAEFDGGSATPVDYKRGRPMKSDDGLDAWPSDRVQMAVQGLVLRANGYRSDQGVVFYQQTRQRVRVPFDDETMAWAERSIADAWETAGASEIPPPLVDSPKCPGCSLVGICMPDETWSLHSRAGNGSVGPAQALRDGARSPRNPPGEGGQAAGDAAGGASTPLPQLPPSCAVGKSGGLLRVKERDKVVQDARISEICQVNLMGAVQISTQAVQEPLPRGEAHLLLFPGRLVLRRDHRPGNQERLPAQGPVPTGGTGVVLPAPGQEAGWRARSATSGRCCCATTSSLPGPTCGR